MHRNLLFVSCSRTKHNETLSIFLSPPSVAYRLCFASRMRTHSPLVLHSLYFLLHTILSCSTSQRSPTSHINMASTQSAECKFMSFTTVFLCYAFILAIHLHTIHTQVFVFMVETICDPEQSPSDSVDPFITQNHFVIPVTQDQDTSHVVETDLLETHGTHLTTPSLEGHDDDLTNTKKNLLRDLKRNMPQQTQQNTHRI